MKVLYCLLSLLLPLTSPLFAQKSVPAALIQAAKFNGDGQFRSTISLLEPVLQPGSPTLHPADAGVGWNLLGSAYQDVGDYEHARRSYERAIQILQQIAGEELQYAAALDNLGSVNFDTGQLDASRELRQKARKLYRQAGEREGVARTSSNLALIEFQQNHMRKTKSELDEAFREIGRIQSPDKDDLAAMYSIRCSLAGHEGKVVEALAAVEQAIRLWTEQHGEHYYKLPAGYSLRGQAHAELRNYTQAEQDLTHALALIKETTGTSNPSYFVTELAYAHVLQATGAEQEAAALQREAENALENFRHQQCSGCTVSAWSLR
jgi:tetratricopeptide (TPR) repeat protein